MRIRSRNRGCTVEVIAYAESGEGLRVTQYDYFHGQVRTPAELAGFGLDLADFEEVAA